MTELVIDAPHLQTQGQRLGSGLFTLAGWLLWSYFFFPLVTLSCWLVDNDVCSQWVNLSGGYLSLQEILLIYIKTVLGMACLWGIWIVHNIVRGRGSSRQIVPASVDFEDLCAAFQVDQGIVWQCQRSRMVVVQFDEHGRIVSLDGG